MVSMSSFLRSSCNLRNLSLKNTYVNSISFKVCQQEFDRIYHLLSLSSFIFWAFAFKIFPHVYLLVTKMEIQVMVRRKLATKLTLCKKKSHMYIQLRTCITCMNTFCDGYVLSQLQLLASFTHAHTHTHSLKPISNHSNASYFSHQVQKQSSHMHAHKCKLYRHIVHFLSYEFIRMHTHDLSFGCTYAE